MLSFSDAQADWVRPGLLLYGVSLLYGFSGTTHFAGIAAAMKDGVGIDEANVDTIVRRHFFPNTPEEAAEKIEMKAT